MNSQTMSSNSLTISNASENLTYVESNWFIKKIKSTPTNTINYIKKNIHSRSRIFCILLWPITTHTIDTGKIANEVQVNHHYSIKVSPHPVHYESFHFWLQSVTPQRAKSADADLLGRKFFPIRVVVVILRGQLIFCGLG